MRGVRRGEGRDEPIVADLRARLAHYSTRGTVACAVCHRRADEAVVIEENWRYWLSNDAGELLPACPDCSRAEFPA
jgi:hypothetical protein